MNKYDILKKHSSKYFIKQDNGKFIVKQSKGGKYEEVATKRNKLAALYEIKSLYEKENQNEQTIN